MTAREPPPPGSPGQPDDHQHQHRHLSRDFAAWRARLAARLAALPPDRAPVVLIACGSFNPPTRAHLRLFAAGATAAASDDGARGASGGLAATSVVVGGLLSPVADAYAKAGLAPAGHRLAMCALAARHGAGEEEIGDDGDAAGAPTQQQHPLHCVDVGVHGWEATRATYTRTLDVLRHITRELNSAGDGGDGEDQTTTGDNVAPATAAAPRPVRVMLLGGTDLLESMRKPGAWSDPEVLLREHGVVCVERRTAEGPEAAPPPAAAPGAVDEALLASCVVHAAVSDGDGEDAMADVSSSRAREALRAAISDAAAAAGTTTAAEADRARLAAKAAGDPRVAALLDPRVAEYAAVHGLY